MFAFWESGLAHQSLLWCAVWYMYAQSRAANTAKEVNERCISYVLTMRGRLVMCACVYVCCCIFVKPKCSRAGCQIATAAAPAILTSNPGWLACAAT